MRIRIGEAANQELTYIHRTRFVRRKSHAFAVSPYRSVLREMGPQIQWVESYVKDDKIYCVFIAPDEDTIRTHAQKGGFPANRISRVRTVIAPTTSEALQQSECAAIREPSLAEGIQRT